ncbi:MAG TPA: CsbD family protein [Pirellulales bacterium]|jgi:uncharacterized protein YjbJ (UPF0337 family)|nr:CsbD family protein [Pirellulales bacterium]
MAGKAKEIKGRLEEAAGAILDNKRLKRQGKTDQVVGRVEQKLTGKKPRKKVPGRVENVVNYTEVP